MYQGASPLVDSKQASGQKDDESKGRSFLKEALPLGVGFHPSDANLAELLERKVLSKDGSTFDFYSYDPDNFHLAMAEDNIHFHDDGKTYIFSARRSKFPGAAIINRDTPNGHWMLSGKLSKAIENSKGEATAMKVSATFRANGNGNGTKRERETETEPETRTRTRTPWHMQEFRLIGENCSEIVLGVVYKDCKVMKKVGTNYGTSSSPYNLKKVKRVETDFGTSSSL